MHARMGHPPSPAFAMQCRYQFYIFMVFCMGKFATLQAIPVRNSIGRGVCYIYNPGDTNLVYR